MEIKGRRIEKDITFVSFWTISHISKHKFGSQQRTKCPLDDDDDDDG